MNTDFQLFPTSASTVSDGIDALYLFLVALTCVITAVIALFILFLAIRYRRGSPASRTGKTPGLGLELAWLIVPLPILMFIFVWGAQLYFRIHSPPADAEVVDVVAKQWMWKFQHESGHREIDQLHVPVGQPIRLRLISQDVIHSFYVPIFRIKQDVLPGRYTDIWFEATDVGEYQLFCAEYCGTDHATMTGKIIVMSPADFEQWLATGGQRGEPAAMTGKKLFARYRCDSCHLQPQEKGRGPTLHGIYGKQVPLANGRTVVADEAYLRSSILEPNKHIVAGYSPLMPTFQGQINEEEVLQLISYIKSLEAPEEGGRELQP